jgi:hypothetical protein
VDDRGNGKFQGGGCAVGWCEVDHLCEHVRRINSTETATSGTRGIQSAVRSGIECDRLFDGMRADHQSSYPGSDRLSSDCKSRDRELVVDAAQGHRAERRCHWAILIRADGFVC